MASRKKFKSRRKFLVGSGAAALIPAAIAIAPKSISVRGDFPPAKFGIGEEVGTPSEDNPMICNRGIVIGLAHEPTGYYESGWWYLVRWENLPESRHLEGVDDGNFLHEGQIRRLS